MLTTLVWIAVAAFAVIALAFCGYEVWWKSRKLRNELLRLHTVNDRLASLRVALADARQRLSRISPG